MNKFVKLPLFLSIISLLAGGMLSSVFALTDSIINEINANKKAEAYNNMYYSNNVKFVSKQVDFKNKNGLVSAVLVDHNGLVSAVYECSSSSSYESMTFYVGFDMESKVVDGYYSLSTSSSSVGYGDYFKDEKTVMEKYQDYDGSQNVIFSGVTYTSNAVKKCIDSALDDLKQRKWEEL